MKEKSEPGKNAPEIKFVSVRVEPYLAEYAQSVYGCGRQDGAVKIPYTSTLYHVLWYNMHRRPADCVDPADGNLRILLPDSRMLARDEGMRKNPRYWNWLPPRGVQAIEHCLLSQFNYEFRTSMMENEESGRPCNQFEVVWQFMHRHRLTQITEDALLKNFQRYRRKLYPKRVRKYDKKT